MESLESKLDHLAPDQRREVEDFVDFLIQRAEGIRVTVQVASHEAPALPKSVAPPLISSDPVPVEEPAILQPRADAPPAAVMPVHEAEPPAVIQEIAGDDGSDSSDGYFDYGRFEKTAPPAPLPPSPADETIKKVKRKLIQKSEQVSKNQLLDWID
jgi:hypothetical protein